jgi:hypothetical protein
MTRHHRFSVQNLASLGMGTRPGPRGFAYRMRHASFWWISCFFLVDVSSVWQQNPRGVPPVSEKKKTAGHRFIGMTRHHRFSVQNLASLGMGTSPGPRGFAYRVRHASFWWISCFFLVDFSSVWQQNPRGVPSVSEKKKSSPSIHWMTRHHRFSVQNLASLGMGTRPGPRGFAYRVRHASFWCISCFFLVDFSSVWQQNPRGAPLASEKKTSRTSIHWDDTSPPVFCAEFSIAWDGN